MKKKFIKKIYIAFSKLIIPLFYDKKYLKGRHFDNNIKGWYWCWRNLFMQKIIGYNRTCPFPVSFRNEIGQWKNIKFDIDDLNNFQHYGVYFQSWHCDITIGKGTYIAPNVGLITENHDINNLDQHNEPEPIKIGKSCWIGMNAVILPGVCLGDNTIVGAGAVVTRSFPEGNCVVGGVPAKKIKSLETINDNND
ncbi:acyltransferase [Lederbergia lenta]|uniref:Maltose transacetylase n=1 Tax=Lederbergia lenta TaxID=1467 RepID=A0A2X4WT48_LEDLE|nr:acyltransferase [Lederbergia lenta]MEC2323149.1 acyltransferase [Lederbergia lenta]SQI62818.1 maltose transacetylase [Lederbergia lenta]